MPRTANKAFPAGKMNELNQTVCKGFTARAMSLTTVLNAAITKGDREGVAKAAKIIVKNLKQVIEECYSV